MLLILQVNYMRSRQGLVACEGLGISQEEVADLLPIIEEGLSDSGSVRAKPTLFPGNDGHSPYDFIARMIVLWIFLISWICIL
eukprot:COSAG05_NODE_4610_length_1440_cov_0.975391_1_plen_82_part_10